MRAASLSVMVSSRRKPGKSLSRNIFPAPTLKIRGFSSAMFGLQAAHDTSPSRADTASSRALVLSSPMFLTVKDSTIASMLILPKRCRASSTVRASLAENRRTDDLSGSIHRDPGDARTGNGNHYRFGLVGVNLVGLGLSDLNV